MVTSLTTLGLESGGAFLSAHVSNRRCPAGMLNNITGDVVHFSGNNQPTVCQIAVPGNLGSCKREIG